MKRTISLFLILATLTIAGNAQYFVEGSISVDYNDATPVFTGYKPEVQYADSYFSVSPLVGYQLNDAFAIGAKASFNRKTNWWFPPDGYTGDLEKYRKIKQRWEFTVFCRYKIWGTEKLSFLVESSVYVGGGSTEERTGLITKKIESSTSFGLDASPLIIYDISDKWSLVTTYPLFNLGLIYGIGKNEETGIKSKTYVYGFNARSSFSNPLSAIKIGFIYKF